MCIYKVYEQMLSWEIYKQKSRIRRIKPLRTQDVATSQSGRQAMFGN